MCHSRWMCECSLDSMLVLLHALLSANCAWVGQTVGNNGFQSAAILLLHCMWSILYAVLLFHCFKFPLWSFKDQQVPVSVGIWANVMGTKTLSSDSAKFILEFCLHCLIKIHIWHVQCFRIHKKPSLVWGIKNPYEWILVKYEAKHPQRTKNCVMCRAI